MIKRMLINASQRDELRVAITADAVLVDLDIEHPGQEQKKSNIYKGRISSIEPSLGAVFVDYGSERHGFLPLKEISPEYFLTPIDTNSLENVDIKKALREGQEIVVQVDKEERGTKGAALTTFISLAGCYLVLMPNNPDAGGISRRIEGEDRDQLREIIEKLPVPEGMGVIIRTAGVSRSQEELDWDLKVLLRYWEAIKQAAVARPGPYLIHQESDVIIRAVRDHLRQDISEVLIDSPDAFNRAKEYIRQVRPDFIEHIKLYTDTMPLFSRFQIEKQIEAAYQREVRLPSGGSIVIDHSEALVAIDINSARATKGGNIEETALQTNLEAADEIARQLRIRDIGGLVVIDFIDMTPVRNQREVENRLRNGLHLDRARIQIGRISRFGLLEMSRQRLRAALSVSSEISCPRCEGRGSIRSVESVTISILHLIQETASRNNAHIQVQLPINIATFMLNEKRDALKEIETQSKAQITIIPNSHLKSPHYHLKTSRDENSKFIPSYKLVKVPRAESTPPKPVIPPTIAEPAISQYLTDEHIPAPKKPQTNGLIKRLWDLMFEPKPVVQKPTPKPSRPNTPRPRTDQRRDDQHGNRQPRRDRNPRHHNRDNKDNRGENREAHENRGNTDEQSGNTATRRPPREEGQRRDRNNNRGGRPQQRDRQQQKPRAEQQAEARHEKPQHAHHDATAETMPIEKSAVIPEKHHEKTAVEKVVAPEKAVILVVEKQVEHVAPVAAPVIAEAKPVVEQPVISAPTASAEAYQHNYKGLSSGKPLQQVTTKKSE